MISAAESAFGSPNIAPRSSTATDRPKTKSHLDQPQERQLSEGAPRSQCLRPLRVHHEVQGAVLAAQGQAQRKLQAQLTQQKVQLPPV